MSQTWHPITDYEIDPEELSDKELHALSGVWFDRRDALGRSRNVRKFTERLKREWAIETGLIEQLYTLDRGITELMIEQGINSVDIPRGASTSPGNTKTMIGDQEAAIESIFAFVKGNRRLTTSYIKELHSLFTRNQKFAEGRDQLGRTVRVPLLRGAYKEQPNNPTRPDGSVDHYCPPEHVASEMDRLIELHLAHDGIALEVEAAWLHHRFVQIHPFQDGNGRIARALATLVFVKANWLPLVVRAVDRKRYIEALESADKGDLGDRVEAVDENIKALESADKGDLKPLVSFFAGLQKDEFIRVLGIARDVEQEARTKQHIESLKQRLVQRQDALEQEWEAAVSTAEQTHAFARKRLEEVRNLLRTEIGGHAQFDFFVDDKKNEDPHSHYFYHQVVSTAKELKYYANTKHYRSWVRLGLVGKKDGNKANILIAFHCMGPQFQGVLACSGTWFLRTRTDGGEATQAGLAAARVGDHYEYETGGETALSDKVFQINYKEAPEDVQTRFKDWLEPAINRGLALWGSAF